MELRVVDYFVTVAEQGSLRGAAQRLGVTQPALTKAIRRLEDEAGVVLFDRRARGVVLTVYGRALLRHARNLRASLEEAREELAALKDGIAGRVRVGAGPSWQREVLPEAIAAFRAARPQVRIEVTGGMDDRLKALLRAGELDLVLAATPDAAPIEPDLDRVALMTDEYRVIARRGHPLRAREPLELAPLLDFPWILPGPRSTLVDRLRTIFRANGLPAPEVAVETDIAGLKMRLMRDADYLSFHAMGQLQELGEPAIQPLAVPAASWRRAAGIITRHGTEPNPAAIALIEIIGEVCRAHGGLATAA
jgi:DNA-binding transcriptional LysR family regulator